MKKLLSLSALILLFCTSISCTQNPETPEVENTVSTAKTTDKTPVIYLASDSTVKTYTDEQYIAGWGQYLNLFLDDKVTVVNCAQGGRSSRSFINEGRLFDIDGCSYSFTQNDGNSIGDVIKEGDFLFIQFGHNDDDTKKESSYSSLYDRMVPLGTPDSNGIYPVTEGTRVSTTYLPEEYTSNVSSTAAALTETAKYGDTYYAYDSGGTYKWFLKQYIDFARSKGAIPVLVTPVARVKFSGTEIVGGPGLHGENFAYVQAVRQLAEEEDCLLIDLFAESKILLETAGPDYANYLMALVPNDLTGTWPADYDNTYGNVSLGYQKTEATHYNKYGAFLLAAKLAEDILKNSNTCSGSEYFTFTDHIETAPESFIDPSNLISKTVVTNLEALYTKETVKDPSLTYNDPAAVVALIEAIAAKGTVTTANYTEFKTLCEAARAAYIKLNIDDRALVTNLSDLVTYEEAVTAAEQALKPTPTKVVVLNAESLTAGDITSTTAADGYTIVAASAKPVTVKSYAKSFTYSGTTYELTQALSMGGAASYGNYRYLSFSTTGACTVTVAAQSTGTDSRTVGMVSGADTSTLITTFDAGASTSITSYDMTSAGTYYMGSTNKGVYIFQIIIEYYE